MVQRNFVFERIVSQVTKSVRSVRSHLSSAFLACPVAYETAARGGVHLREGGMVRCGGAYLVSA